MIGRTQFEWYRGFFIRLKGFFGTDFLFNSDNNIYHIREDEMKELDKTYDPGKFEDKI